MMTKPVTNLYPEYEFKDIGYQKQSSDWAHRYCWMILNNKITTNKWLKLLAQKHFDDLARLDDPEFKFKFSSARAQHALNAFELMTQAASVIAKQEIKLLPWQQFLIASIFGWINKDIHPRYGYRTRRFKTCLTYVGRKNGKSLLASGIALYMLLFDSEGKPEVYTAAGSQKQAAIVFKSATQMLRQLHRTTPELKQISRLLTYEIIGTINDGTFSAVSAEASNLEGKDIHCGIVDEIHVHKSSEVLDVIGSGCGARAQPLIFIISTAGNILDGVAVEQWKYGEQVLEGIIKDESYLPLLYCIDDGDDLTQKANWIKANPGLGISPSYEYLEDQLQQAINIPSKRVNFITKFCNRFHNSADRWLDFDTIQQCISDININDYKNKKCYIGIDLALKTDLTAISIIFPNELGGIDVFSKHYIPEDTLTTATTEQQHLYRKWEQNDFINITSGAVVDFNKLEEDLKELCQTFDVQHVAYDPWQMRQLAMKLESDGLPMIEIAQRKSNLSEPAKELEAMLLSKTLRYNGDSVFAWCCANAYAETDQYENFTIKKENKQSPNKIDSVIACITALSVCILTEPVKSSVYETRGIRSFNM